MQLLLFPHILPHEADRSLSLEQQREVLFALLRGGSPQAACQKLGADPRAFCRARERDAAFREGLQQVRELMTLNVVATVYRAAMEGTPAAQALWLRTFAPPEWAEPASKTPDTSFETTNEFASLPTDAIRRLLAAFHSEFSASLTTDESAHSA